jgi:hypothetical protein
MLFHGMAKEGVECITSIRARYDGEKRNPWDEAECGHHYARAMAAWSGILALSGFHYDGRSAAVTALPRFNAANFRSFWSAGTGWGVFSVANAGVRVQVLKGKLACRSAEFRGSGGKASATLGSRTVASKVTVRNGIARIEFDDALTIGEGEELKVDLRA